jgi:hypothetical protein
MRGDEMRWDESSAQMAAYLRGDEMRWDEMGWWEWEEKRWEWEEMRMGGEEMGLGGDDVNGRRWYGRRGGGIRRRGGGVPLGELGPAQRRAQQVDELGDGLGVV